MVSIYREDMRNPELTIIKLLSINSLPFILPYSPVAHRRPQTKVIGHFVKRTD
jgi:hypothetical protein